MGLDNIWTFINIWVRENKRNTFLWNNSIKKYVGIPCWKKIVSENMSSVLEEASLIRLN